MCLNILTKSPYFKVVLDDHLWKVYRVLITKIIDSLLNFASIISFVRLYFLTANFLTLTYIDMKWKEKDLTICSFRFSFLNVQCLFLFWIGVVGWFYKLLSKVIQESLQQWTLIVLSLSGYLFEAPSPNLVLAQSQILAKS